MFCLCPLCVAVWAYQSPGDRRCRADRLFPVVQHSQGRCLWQRSGKEWRPSGNSENRCCVNCSGSHILVPRIVLYVAEMDLMWRVLGQPLKLKIHVARATVIGATWIIIRPWHSMFQRHRVLRGHYALSYVLVTVWIQVIVFHSSLPPSASQSPCSFWTLRRCCRSWMALSWSCRTVPSHFWEVSIIKHVCCGFRHCNLLCRGHFGVGSELFQVEDVFMCCEAGIAFSLLKLVLSKFRSLYSSLQQKDTWEQYL